MSNSDAIITRDIILNEPKRSLPACGGDVVSGFILHLPMPPSLNHANAVGRNKRTGKPQVYPSKEKIAFFKEAGDMYMMQRPPTLRAVPGPFTYHLILNEEMRHGNSDGDNRGKYVLDFVQRVGLIENDKLALGGSWSWGPCEHGAMLSVRPANSVHEK
jgi:hypothetical protein